jgi:hypothetical protein
MDIALFVDPTAKEYATAVEAATFIAETAIGLGRPLILSCTPSAALDIGLSSFGSRVPRTIEGGERRSSPIILLPLIRREKDPIEDRFYPDRDSKRGDAGTLADLVDLGVIASREETDIDPFSGKDPVEAFIDALRRWKTPIVFGLGSQSALWKPTLSQLREIPNGRLIAVPEFTPPDLPQDDPTIEIIRRAEIPERPYRREEGMEAPKDEFEPFVVEARRQAALTAALIEAVLSLS